MKSFCKFHPRQVAHFTCPQCGSSFCPNCVVRREKGGYEPGRYLHFCPKCNLPADWVGAANIVDPVWVRMPKIFFYPMRLNPLILMGLSALAVLLFSGAGLIHTIVRGSVWLIVLKYSFESLKATARGDLRPPKITADTIFGDVMQVFKQFGIYVLIALGFGFVTIKLGPLAGIASLLAALFFVPAMIILLVTTESLLFAVNPLAFVRLTFRIGWAYVLMYFFLLLLGGAPAFVGQFFLPLLPERLVLVLMGAAESFYTIVSYHLMGYVILQYHDRIGYQVDFEDFRDPDAMPTHPAEVDPDQAILSEAEPLIQEGKLDEAIAVIKNRSAAEGIHGLNLSQRYYNLLKMRKRHSDLLAHAPRLMSRLVEANSRAKVMQIYAECTRIDPRFLAPAGVLFKLSGWLNEAGKTKESVGALNRMINHHPDDPLTPKAYLRAAQIFNDRLMSADKAKKILQALKLKYPQSEILPQVDNYLANL